MLRLGQLVLPASCAYTLTRLNFAIIQNSSLFVFGVTNADGRDRDPQHAAFHDSRLIFFLKLSNVRGLLAGEVKLA